MKRKCWNLLRGCVGNEDVRSSYCGVEGNMTLMFTVTVIAAWAWIAPNRSCELLRYQTSLKTVFIESFTDVQPNKAKGKIKGKLRQGRDWKKWESLIHRAEEKKRTSMLCARMNKRSVAGSNFNHWYKFDLFYSFFRKMFQKNIHSTNVHF